MCLFAPVLEAAATAALLLAATTIANAALGATDGGRDLREEVLDLSPPSPLLDGHECHDVVVFRKKASVSAAKKATSDGAAQLPTFRAWCAPVLPPAPQRALSSVPAVGKDGAHRVLDEMPTRFGFSVNNYTLHNMQASFSNAKLWPLIHYHIINFQSVTNPLISSVKLL